MDNLFRAMGNFMRWHLIDRNLYPFSTLQATGVVAAGGDRAFDADEACGLPGRRNSHAVRRKS